MRSTVTDKTAMMDIYIDIDIYEQNACVYIRMLSENGHWSLTVGGRYIGDSKHDYATHMQLYTEDVSDANGRRINCKRTKNCQT